jgi:hypothetical protein
LYSRGQSFEDVDSNYIECNNIEYNDIDASKDYVARFQIYLKVI